MSEPLAAPQELLRELRAYQRALGERSRLSDEVDPALARALADGCTRLVSTIGPATPEAERRVIQAAVRYFVLEDDAEGDFDSVIGLDDDAEVLNAALRHLGREAWSVQTR
ncbi:MAG: hypothetical protein HY744_33170 [Deltaproteobacteria bacterium]|nr:hypothetical protein [Deltaproteobacteria bacterium]